MPAATTEKVEPEPAVETQDGKSEQTPSPSTPPPREALPHQIEEDSEAEEPPQALFPQELLAMRVPPVVAAQLKEIIKNGSKMPKRE